MSNIIDQFIQAAQSGLGDVGNAISTAASNVVPEYWRDSQNLENNMNQAGNAINNSAPVQAAAKADEALSATPLGNIAAPINSVQSGQNFQGPANRSVLSAAMLPISMMMGGDEGGGLKTEDAKTGELPEGTILDAQGNPIVKPKVNTWSQYVADKDGSLVENKNFMPGTQNPTHYAQQAPEAQEVPGLNVQNPGGSQVPPEAPQEPASAQERTPPGQAPPLKKIPMITKNEADPQAVANYKSVFQVPTSVVGKMKITPEQIINQLIDDDITNIPGKSVNDVMNKLKGVVNTITGQNGAMSNINRYILGNIKTPVSYSDAQTAIDEELPKMMKDEKGSVVDEVQREIKKSFSPVDYQNMPDRQPAPTMPNNSAYASDLFKVSQNLGDAANYFHKKSLDYYGDIKNLPYDRAQDAVLNIKNNVDDAIDKATKDNYASYKNDPYVQSQVQRMPPKVAQRFMYGAERFKDGQTIQAPYVGLDSMITKTKNSQIAIATKLMQEQMAKSRSERMVSGTRTFLEHPVANTVAGAAQKILSPFVDKSQDQMFSDLTSGKVSEPSAETAAEGTAPSWKAPSAGAAGESKNTSGLKVAAGLLGTGVILAAGHKLIKGNPNTYGQESANNNQGVNSSHGLSVAQNGINVNTLSPQSFSALKPDPKTGLWDLPQNPSAGTRTYMSETDYNNGLAAISAKYPAGPQDPHYTVAKTLLDQQYNNDQEQAKQVFQGNNIQNFMDNTTTYNSDGNRLLGTLGSLPTGFWNGVSQAGSVRAYTDQTYTQELQQIDNFDNEFASAYKSVTGNDPSANQLIQSANSPRQAAVKFTSMMQFVNGTYGKYLSPYLAITSATGSQTTQGNPQSFNFPTQSNPGGLPAPAPQSNPSTVNIGGGSPPAWSPQ